MLREHLVVESFVACCLALLLGRDYEMFANLERRVVSGDIDKGVDRMPDSGL